MDLEIRQVGGATVLQGRFPYGRLATISNRGRRRKESIMPRAFRFAIEQEPERKIDILVGHDFGKPIASRQSGTLTIRDSAAAVEFEATLPADPPSWVIDAEKAIRGGLMVGLSPGFVVPPLSVVHNAERDVPEPGNPGVTIRQVHEAVPREFSILTSGAYEDAGVELRMEDLEDEMAYHRPEWRGKLLRRLL